MKTKEIAAAINAHLKRFEADPVINVLSQGQQGVLRYWNATLPPV